MGKASRSRTDELGRASPSFEIEDYILARIKLKGLSVRELAPLAKIGRSRLHDGLHREADKRVPLKVVEIAAVLQALDINPIEALFARDILQKNAGVEFNDLVKVISMVCGIVNGLPEQIITVVKHVEGMGFDDVKPEHGEAAQGLLVRAVEVEYKKLARRRLQRFDEFGTG